MAKKKPADVIDLELARLVKKVREAFRTMKVAEQEEVSAREVSANRRYELGLALLEARPKWPTRGPNAKGWGEFLRSCEIDEDVALTAMKYAGYIDREFPDKSQIRPGKLPTLTEAGLRRQSLTQDEPPAAKPDRGAWCTPKPIAIAVGPWDLDPFSNDRSHIEAAVWCALERGDNGFGSEPIDQRIAGRYFTAHGGHATADGNTRVWLQPDYGYVLEAIEHYKHTLFCALLRLDPSTEWFERLHAETELILIPKGDRIQFDPPDGVEASSNPFPHGLFYRRASDATDAIRDLCYEWRVRAA